MRSLGTAVRTGAELPDVIAEFSQRNALNLGALYLRA
jgi:hypothetical protein